MANSVFLYPYSGTSNTARALADALHTPRIRRTNSTFVGHPDKTVINWGSSSLPREVRACDLVINSDVAVHNVSNKRRFFRMMKEYNGRQDYGVDVARCVPSTESRNRAYEWGKDVVCRAVLEGHGGEGLSIIAAGEPLPDVLLYTMYIKKQDEYRVHLIRTNLAIDEENEEAVYIVQRKARVRDFPDDLVNWRVRNNNNGFIYQHTNFEAPQDVLTQARLAFGQCDLDFGAVDVLWNEHEKQAYVLEINTAPGLTGQTLDAYVTIFKEQGWYNEV